MASALPDDPILPGATWRPMTPRDAVPLAAAVEAARAADGGGEVQMATALLVRSMEAARAAGMEAAWLGVDAVNPTGAVGLCEPLGFAVNRRFVRPRRRVAN